MVLAKSSFSATVTQPTWVGFGRWDSWSEYICDCSWYSTALHWEICVHPNIKLLFRKPFITLYTTHVQLGKLSACFLISLCCCCINQMFNYMLQSVCNMGLGIKHYCEVYICVYMANAIKACFDHVPWFVINNKYMIVTYFLSLPLICLVPFDSFV